MDNQTSIEVKNLTKEYKSFKALDDVSISIQRGEYVCILGPNGAGKTTFLEICEGIRKPSLGDVAILGKSWGKNERELRKKIGLSAQETKFHDRGTVWETLDLFASFYGVSRERVEEVLVEIQLEDKKNEFLMNLSGGQRQRIAIGIAILHKPELLFLDEPTTGLDPKSRREIWAILEKFRKDKMTLILTTHYMEEAEALCDRVIFLHKGKVYKDGRLKELLEQSGSKSLDELFLSLTGSSLAEDV
jgi:ABC-2 type transport system ATP-binding protein